MQTLPYEIATPTQIDAGSLGGQIETPEVGNKELGSSLKELGNTLQNGMDVLNRYNDEHKAQTVQSLIANFNYTPQFLQNKQNAPLGATGFAQDTTDDYEKTKNSYLDKIQDPEVKQKVALALTEQAKSYTNDATNFELNQTEQANKIATSDGLNTIINKTVSNPTPENIESNISEGSKLIDATNGIDALTKEGMKQQLRKQMYDLSGSAISNTAQDTLSSINARNAVEELKDHMSPNEYTSLQTMNHNKINSYTNRAVNAQVSQANNLLAMSNEGHTVDENLINQISNGEGGQAPEVQTQLNIIRNNNKLKQQTASMSTADLRNLAKAQQANATGQPSPNGYVANTSLVKNIPNELYNSAIKASSITGSNMGLIDAVIGHEYSKKDILAGNYGKTASPYVDAHGVTHYPSATGLGQFINSTGLGMVNEYPNVIGSLMEPPLSGNQVANLSDKEKLDLRKNPQVAMGMIGLYTNELKQQASKILGRDVGDNEVYTCYVLGLGNGCKVLQNAQSNPYGSVLNSISAEQAEANKSLFYRDIPKRTPKTNAEVAQELGFHLSISQAKSNYANTSFIQKQIDQREQNYNHDPIQYGIDRGLTQTYDINNPNAGMQRLNDINNIKNDIGDRDSKGNMFKEPTFFSDTEKQQLHDQLEDPNTPTSNKLNMLKSFSSINNYSQYNKALKEIGEKDNAYTFAGNILNSTNIPNKTALASQIIEGSSLLKANPTMAETYALNASNIDKAYKDTVGASLDNSARFNNSALGNMDAIKNTASALYVKQATTKDIGNFNATLYANCLNSAMGGTPNNKSIGMINGDHTVLPSSVSEQDLQHFMYTVNTDDLARYSIDKTPAYILNYDGKPTPLTNDDIPSLVPTFVGGDKNGNGSIYSLRTSDGKDVSTIVKGQPKKLMLSLNQDNINSLINNKSRDAYNEPTNIHNVVDRFTKKSKPYLDEAKDLGSKALDTFDNVMSYF